MKRFHRIVYLFAIWASIRVVFNPIPLYPPSPCEGEGGRFYKEGLCPSLIPYPSREGLNGL
jgi:hypothetical protein